MIKKMVRSTRDQNLVGHFLVRTEWDWFLDKCRFAGGEAQVQNSLDQSKKVFIIIFMDYLIKYSINFKSIFDELVVLNLERPYSWGKNMSNS